MTFVRFLPHTKISKVVPLVPLALSFDGLYAPPGNSLLTKFKF